MSTTAPVTVTNIKISFGKKAYKYKAECKCCNVPLVPTTTTGQAPNNRGFEVEPNTTAVASYVDPPPFAIAISPTDTVTLQFVLDNSKIKEGAATPKRYDKSIEVPLGKTNETMTLPFGVVGSVSFSVTTPASKQAAAQQQAEMAEKRRKEKEAVDAAAAAERARREEEERQRREAAAAAKAPTDWGGLLAGVEVAEAEQRPSVEHEVWKEQEPVWTSDLLPAMEAAWGSMHHAELIAVEEAAAFAELQRLRAEEHYHRHLHPELRLAKLHLLDPEIATLRQQAVEKRREEEELKEQEMQQRELSPSPRSSRSRRRRAAWDYNSDFDSPMSNRMRDVSAAGSTSTLGLTALAEAAEAEAEAAVAAAEEPQNRIDSDLDWDSDDEEEAHKQHLASLTTANNTNTINTISTSSSSVLVPPVARDATDARVILEKHAREQNAERERKRLERRRKLAAAFPAGFNSDFDDDFSSSSSDEEIDNDKENHDDDIEISPVNQRQHQQQQSASRSTVSFNLHPTLLSTLQKQQQQQHSYDKYASPTQPLASSPKRSVNARQVPSAVSPGQRNPLKPLSSARREVMNNSSKDSFFFSDTVAAISGFSSPDQTQQQQQPQSPGKQVTFGGDAVSPIGSPSSPSGSRQQREQQRLTWLQQRQGNLSARKKRELEDLEREERERSARVELDLAPPPPLMTALLHLNRRNPTSDEALRQKEEDEELLFGAQGAAVSVSPQRVVISPQREHHSAHYDASSPHALAQSRFVPLVYDDKGEEFVSSSLRREARAVPSRPHVSVRADGAHHEVAQHLSPSTTSLQPTMIKARTTMIIRSGGGAASDDFSRSSFDQQQQHQQQRLPPPAAPTPASRGSIENPTAAYWQAMAARKGKQLVGVRVPFSAAASFEHTAAQQIQSVSPSRRVVSVGLPDHSYARVVMNARVASPRNLRTDRSPRNSIRRMVAEAAGSSAGVTGTTDHLGRDKSSTNTLSSPLAPQKELMKDVENMLASIQDAASSAARMRRMQQQRDVDEFDEVSPTFSDL